MSKRIDALQEMLQPSVEALGFDLWGIDFKSQGKHSVLRIYIESEAGITVDNCAAVSHQVSGILDVEDPISGEYTLEVSSPGADRPLFSVDQYQQYIGEQVSLRLLTPMNKQRKFKGSIKEVLNAEDVDSAVLVLSLENDELIEMLFSNIDIANIEYQYD